MFVFWIPCSTSRYPFARFTSNIAKIIGYVWMFLAFIMVIPGLIGILDALANGHYWGTSALQILFSLWAIITPLIGGVSLAAGAEIAHSLLDCGDNSFKKNRF
jgi:hypothetical protein